MKHSERAMQSSLEAANNHATSLQHRLAQVVAESSRLHQLLFDTQQCLEGTRAEKSTLMEKLNEMEEKSKKALLVKKQVDIYYVVMQLYNKCYYNSSFHIFWLHTFRKMSH